MIRFSFAAVLLALFALPASAQVRIKDITDVAGARSNQLIGFGLVVGLDGTGSRSTFTQQVAVDMLQRLGVTTQIFSSTPSEAVLRSTNMSAVIVTANIGPFARRGGKLDIEVSAMDDARSLKGGTLLLTSLKGVDGAVYAVAQGPLSIGGFEVAGQAGGIQKNQLNVGRIPEGAMVEKEAPGQFVKEGKSQLLLRSPDFNTARLIAKGINEKYPNVASACDAGSVSIAIPADPKKTPVQFLAEIGLIEVRPDASAKVVINERTGTVVAGENVTLSTAAITHGNLYITIGEAPQVSQPNALSGGTTAVTPRTQVSAQEQKSRMVVLPKSTTVSEVARSLNALGVTPRDLVSIFQGLKEVGALHAELKLQ